ncbi:MAG: polysaccharide deacetylase family protein [Fusobacteriaceae bacterium]|jgi:peptidoglycan/xylan/chitin deacetylase (PgdA/CDA1 family)|nr:polysaccharide deacetylase family protein [Fusobacteriaceae bacterium]
MSIIRKLTRYFGFVPLFCCLLYGEEVVDMPPGQATDSEIKVLLTFDDGPGPYTEKLLDELKEASVHATFFVLGSLAKKNPDVIKRMAEEGHTVANHTWSHPNLLTLNYPKQLSQINRTTAILEELTGQKVKFFRPPYGNAGKKLEQALDLVTVRWGPYDTKDWAEKNRKPAVVADKILQGLVNGSIILLHDPHKSTVEGVALAFSKIKEQGLSVRFLSLDEYFSLNDIAYKPGTAISSFVPKKAKKPPAATDEGPEITSAEVTLLRRPALAAAGRESRTPAQVLVKKTAVSKSVAAARRDEPLITRIQRARKLSPEEIAAEREKSQKRFRKKKWFL